MFFEVKNKKEEEEGIEDYENDNKKEEIYCNKV